MKGQRIKIIKYYQGLLKNLREEKKLVIKNYDEMICEIEAKLKKQKWSSFFEGFDK
jgi:hypothetical protein